jgi:hypothetical protein
MKIQKKKTFSEEIQWPVNFFSLSFINVVKGKQNVNGLKAYTYENKLRSNGDSYVCNIPHSEIKVGS